jgi:LuxR family transcriptional regulator, maltose regulon positive regulatory protein
LYLTLIDTKLRPPRLREGYVTRPRLLAQLDRGLAQGLILISAPAGYGKTSLVVDWLSQRSKFGQRPDLMTAWVSLDENDNDLDSFLRYLTTTIHDAFAPARPCANTQALIGAPQPPPVETIAGTLINDLAGLPRPLLLVLDDYHLITHPAIRQVMATLVRHLPDTLRLLLITRRDLDLPLLARRRAQQQLLEVRAADLRLAMDEARAVLTQTSGADVDKATVALLEEQTEGWVIGLQLAGLSLRDQEDPAAFVRAFQARHHRLIMDFLLDEVLAAQSTPVLDFLLKTSVLERLCDPLCATVVGEGAGDEKPLLADLAHSGLFLASLDEERIWYRYHHLFRDLLLRRLAQEWGPEEIAALHGRAGTWLAQHGHTEEALRHLLAAGEITTAVTLIEHRRHDMLNEGEMQRLERWLSLLPEDVIARHASLLQAKAWVLRWQFRHQAIPPLLRQAEALTVAAMVPAAGEDAIRYDILRGERDSLRAEITFWQSEFQASLAYAQSALACLPRECAFARAVAVLFLLSAQHALGQPDHALRQLNAWLDDEQFQDYALRHLLLLAAGGIFGSIGDLKRLEQIARLQLKLGLDHEKPLSITWARHFLGHVAYQRDRLDEAFAHWSAALDWRYQANLRVYHEVVLGVALIHQTRGYESEARRTLDSLTQALREMNQGQFIPEVEAFRARLALLRGDMSAAVHWTHTGAQPARLPFWFWEANELTRVKVLIAQGTMATCQEAEGLLAACRQYAEATANTWLLIQVWALSALLAQAQGQPEVALAAAERAVRLAEPGGYLRLFVELGPAMADLLVRLAARGVAPDYIGRILAVFPAAPSPEPEALTGRELEILTLLQQELSDKEIAERLFLSVLTVKKHNRNIYHKLRVSGRRSAITKARTLNLIP